MNAKAAVFDMDGVIIDSEALWQSAQIMSLAEFGIAITHDECEQLTMGRRSDEIACIWQEKFNLDIHPSLLEADILTRVVSLIDRYGVAMEGLYEALNYFRREGYKIALATSSAHRVIQVVFDKLGLWKYFDVISSAADVERGKPDPAVYLATAKKLALNPEQCLVIEDSANGFLAAQRAGMHTWVVTAQCHHKKFSQAAGHCRTLSELVTVLHAQHAISCMEI
ncbi:HAD family hydrolase [Superficieibacter electus]|uniref:HAD family hydrolase n=1 Tax=Superficieibacter electus TaxID=2022662 RepID=A0A2P5GWN2_9ENTR|nr:HAD-IA family hydrolase [Superficieibacter electus]POP48007.1 HAD family hydrolase [Superficieibacter electus]POP50968.1 HAD family hydrolase [Superficieibacter electus]